MNKIQSDRVFIEMLLHEDFNRVFSTKLSREKNVPYLKSSCGLLITINEADAMRKKKIESSISK